MEYSIVCFAINLYQTLDALCILFNQLMFSVVMQLRPQSSARVKFWELLKYVFLYSGYLYVTQQTASCCQIVEHKAGVTRCVAMPSVMATGWVGQDSGAVFRRLWTKVHQIKFACVGVSVVCNAVFRLTAIKSRSCAKSPKF